MEKYKILNQSDQEIAAILIEIEDGYKKGHVSQTPYNSKLSQKSIQLILLMNISSTIC